MDSDSPSSYRSQFGSAKFSRVRWVDLGGQQKKFLTTTYDSRSKEIAAWSFVEDAGLSDDLFSCECKLFIDADVNDLLLYHSTKFAAAMSDGSIRLLEYDSGVIKPTKKYTNIYNTCSYNALCYNNDKIISGSEGGNLISIDLEGNRKEIVHLSMASVRSLASISRDVFVSAHLDGQICLWDLRVETKSPRPVFSCRVTDCFQGTTSLAAHPAEPNLIGFGTEDGSIGFLDTRRSNYLLNTVSVFFPVGTVWEVAFHPIYPSNFYCATGKGHLLHLNIKGSGLSNSTSNHNSQARANAWLSPGNANVTALIDCMISVNTFSISTNGIIACSDNQMITYIDKKYLA
ncbi:hypothetical protein ACH3XW_2585 [Acanthocheilonema viteae]|uniref:Nucleoporin Nup43 n=1 Tax=Acanthocheilonema viteae TaxID=6277 RepID=A0A498SF62_ACAVI|nr:unnamed protein product [Acanthocheilonema viteae]